MASRRIGVLGGTFDPFHNGHLVAAVNARASVGLDVVLLVVANDPWQKSGRRQVTPAPLRLAMVEASVADIAGVEPCGVEIERGGQTFTADTLAHLSERDPEAELFVIVGSDLAGELESWKRVEEIRERATLIVVERPGRGEVELPGWQVERVQIPRLAISSTDLRRRVAGGEPVDGLMPPAAVRLVAEHGLYAETR